MDVQADAASKADATLQEEARGAFAFAGLVLDLDACTLKRESGAAIALTRGEFALLREFVRRPGRVLSRDFLLDAAVGRRNAPFDRSVDVMVGRLRKKVEPDPNNRALSRPFRAKATASARCSDDVNRPPKLSPLRPPARRGTRLSPPATAVPWTWRALWPVLAAAVALCVIAAIAVVQRFLALYAAICVRLGRLNEACRAIADALKAGTKLSIAKEGSTPQVEPQRTAYLNDLRAAGAPEN